MSQPRQFDILRTLNSPPSWTVFSLTFAAVFLSHGPLLRLPYYWDEAGYYIPAAFDFFRTGSLIPFSTLSNAHPPLPSIYLAACWKLFGYSPFVTRTAMCVIAALALTAVWRIAIIASNRRSVALATLTLTAIYPVFFAQSSLAHADLFAAAGTLWALAFFIDGQRMWPVVVCFSLAALPEGDRHRHSARACRLAGMACAADSRLKERTHRGLSVAALASSLALGISTTGIAQGLSSEIQSTSDITRQQLSRRSEY